MPANESREMAEGFGAREDLRRVFEQLGALTAEVKHLAHSMEQTVGFGERLMRAETEIGTLKQALRDEESARESAERSAATERRWVIGTLITAVIGLAAVSVAIVALFVQHH